MDNAAKAAYLAAFIDGEGHVGKHPMKNGGWTRHVAFNNTDRQLFDAVITMAADLGFVFRTYRRKGQKEGWADQSVAYLTGGKEAFERFERMIPIQANRKRRALSDIIASYVSQETIAAANIAKRTRVAVHCPACGTDFEAWPADINRGQGKFCSVKCGAASRSRKIQKFCIRCGDGYLVAQPRGRISKFCSATCRDAAQGDRIRTMAKLAAEARWGKRS